MVKNPPKHKIINLGDIEKPQFEFLTLRHMMMKLEYSNGELSQGFQYDVVDRIRRDVSVICAYDLSEGEPKIWLRSCVRPNLSLRFPELEICEYVSTWELPAGLIDEGESPLEAGIRELHEETGFKVPKVEFLGKPLWGSVGSMAELLWFFSVDVTGLKRTNPPEDGSPLEKYGECILLSLDETLGICDTKTDTGVYRLARKLKYDIKEQSNTNITNTTYDTNGKIKP